LVDQVIEFRVGGLALFGGVGNGSVELAAGGFGGFVGGGEVGYVAGVLGRSWWGLWASLTFGGYPNPSRTFAWARRC
jgi:hypothetical protein